MQYVSISSTSLWVSDSQKRLAKQRTPLKWHQHRIPKHFIPPFKTTNILRKAINNAIKHGDGNTRQGYGHKNMQRQIQYMNGKIGWRSGKKGGCHVIWAVPLADHL